MVGHLQANEKKKIEEIAQTITVDDLMKNVQCLNERYAVPWDVLVRCSNFISESEGK